MGHSENNVNHSLFQTGLRLNFTIPLMLAYSATVVQNVINITFYHSPYKWLAEILL